MELIPYIFIVTLIAAFITRWVRIIKKGKELPKNDPVNIKTGTPVLYNNIEHVVIGKSEGKYDLRTADNLYILVRRVKRSSLIIAS